MDSIYLIIVIVLLGLAVLDLIVGVSNDAVNFLNSSIGSKVAPIRIIFAVAALGILLGTMFSSGMMEVARSGVFYPEKFTFPSVMMLFLAVMLTDVILRSEEHTSELQSRPHLVCRLLLEKKKKKK